jgi:hypothetical protein
MRIGDIARKYPSSIRASASRLGGYRVDRRHRSHVVSIPIQPTDGCPISRSVLIAALGLCFLIMGLTMLTAHGKQAGLYQYRFQPILPVVRTTHQQHQSPSSASRLSVAAMQSKTAGRIRGGEAKPKDTSLTDGLFLIEGANYSLPDGISVGQRREADFIPSLVKASFGPWKDLVVSSRWRSKAAAAAPTAKPQVHDHEPTGGSSSNPPAGSGSQGAEGVPREDDFDSSASEARAFLDLSMRHWLPRDNRDSGQSRASVWAKAGAAWAGSSAFLLPHELQQPEVGPLLDRIGRIWRAHPRRGSKAVNRTAEGGRSGGPLNDGVKDPRTPPAVDHCSSPSGAALLRELNEEVERLRLASCGADNTFLAKAKATGLPYVFMRRITMAVLHILRSASCQSQLERVSLSIL